MKYLSLLFLLSGALCFSADQSPASKQSLQELLAQAQLHANLQMLQTDLGLMVSDPEDDPEQTLRANIEACEASFALLLADEDERRHHARPENER